MATMTANLTALSLANNDFSFSLYTELAKKETGNLFYSPLSIHVIMFMASVGAVSKTFDEMIATIHLNKNTHSLDAYKDLLEELIISKSDDLKLATGMFVDTKFNVKESYINDSKTYLKSTLEKLSFNNAPEAQRQFINNWVLGKTNNKIKDLFPIGSVSENTKLVLANAVHFKSGWKHEFDEGYNEPFYLTPKDQVNVKMMVLEHDLKYYHDDELKFTAIELPYNYLEFKMMILLPDAKDGLINLENNFSKISLRGISKKMSKHHVTVKLPRFKIEQTLQLEEILSNLGCPTMFTSEANFSNIAEGGNLYVSKVSHKAYVDVDEKGTEAAAATSLAISLMSLEYPSPNKVNFVADHPFFFSIMSYSNHVLFMGRLSKL